MNIHWNIGKSKTLGELNTGCEFTPADLSFNQSRGPFIKHNLSGLDHYRVYDLGNKEWKTFHVGMRVIPVKLDIQVTAVN